LFVKGNTVLACPVVAQLFQSVAERNPQIPNSRSRVEHRQFLLGRPSQIPQRHASALARIPEFLRAPVGEGLNHKPKV
jgi:hypothetical protein